MARLNRGTDTQRDGLTPAPKPHHTRGLTRLTQVGGEQSSFAAHGQGHGLAVDDDLGQSSVARQSFRGRLGCRPGPGQERGIAAVGGNGEQCLGSG